MHRIIKQDGGVLAIVLPAYDLYLDRTQDISTTELKKSLKKLITISPDELKAALSVIAQLQKDLE
ncbi:hypothetical protein TAO_1592 [Candidatus Nitrosoglobus terrae]|uniref:Uncharacterized protein n=1 Tax=Candidatus Nitrosoglobus terrae TaxID=1630141 RepID=A0A1Q2SPA9_9GAMM|nr:hypothetical protein [Candidatus Nitrosoglobus terrae]BAW80962.1 hypothetical protein TAO_1592 [Candidatus Nitrosoglobus terrae]